MNDETYGFIMRSIMDEHTDLKALDRIAYACEQQAAHIDFERNDKEFEQYKDQITGWRE